MEVWDVVDHGKPKVSGSSLKINNSDVHDVKQPALDASFVDVYKGTNGVLLMFDITKQWTFTYVVNEIPKIPSHIPVLLLGNHRDMGHHRVITTEQATSLVHECNRYFINIHICLYICVTFIF